MPINYNNLQNSLWTILIGNIFSPKGETVHWVVWGLSRVTEILCSERHFTVEFMIHFFHDYISQITFHSPLLYWSEGRNLWRRYLTTWANETKAVTQIDSIHGKMFFVCCRTDLVDILPLHEKQMCLLNPILQSLKIKMYINWNNSLHNWPHVSWVSMGVSSHIHHTKLMITVICHMASCKINHLSIKRSCFFLSVQKNTAEQLHPQIHITVICYLHAENNQQIQKMQR